MKKIFYTWNDFDIDVKNIIKFIEKEKWKLDGIYGIPKGGLPLAVALANYFELPLYTSVTEIITGSNVLLVDDISDSGQTLFSIPGTMNTKVITLFMRECSNFKPDYYINSCTDAWIVFPWEPKHKKCERDGTGI